MNGKNDYEKELFVYNYLANRNKYSSNYSFENQSAYTGFNPDLDTVCSGYAKAAQIIFQNIGLDSELVLGTYGNQFHIWKRVKIKGDYYSFDSCITGFYSNSDTINYRGFNFNEKDSIYTVYYENLLSPTTGTKYLNKEI